MKKFVDPYAGIAFDTIEDALDDFCKRTLTGNNCGSRCAIGNQTFQSCREWVKKHPDEAADIMSLDVVEVEVMPAPRLAEVLGVEEDEVWTYPGFGGKYRIHGGIRQYKCGEGSWFNCSNESCLAELINHPESIIHLQRLTEPEIAIMRSVGAKWVSHGNDTRAVRVELWPEKPQKNDFGVFVGTRSIARVNADLFPSVKPGDCIGLEEADKREEVRT